MISDSSINTPGTDGNGAGERDEETTPSSGTPTPAAMAEELQTKLQESEKKYLYLYSEFENFRRRNERDRLDFIKFGHESFLKELLQITDNFERAMAHAKPQAGSEKGSTLSQLVQGIEMIHFQFIDALKDQGVVPVASMGQKFDPTLHEAVGEEESESEGGTVIREMQKGYKLHGRLLRPARVILAKPRAGA